MTTTATTRPVVTRRDLNAFEATLAANLGAALDNALNWAAAETQLTNGAYMTLRGLLVGGGVNTGLVAATAQAASTILAAAMGDNEPPLELLELLD